MFPKDECCPQLSIRQIFQDLFNCTLPQAYNLQIMCFLEVYPQIMYSFLCSTFCAHYIHLQFFTLLIYSKQCKPWICIVRNFIHPHIASPLSGPHTVLSNLLLRTLNLIPLLLLILMQQTRFHIHTDLLYLLYYVCIAVLTLDAGLLARSYFPEGPATGHLDTGFSWFACVYKRMLRWFPSFQAATTCLSCSPPDLNSLVSFLSIFV